MVARAAEPTASAVQIGGSRQHSLASVELISMALVIVLSLVAALLNARAAFMQQQGIQAVLGAGGADAFGIARRLRSFVRVSRWRRGWGVDLVGYGCQAGALYLGSVAVVQPLLTTQLLFTLFIVSWQRRTLPRASAWWGGAAICAGLALLMLVQGDALSGPAERGKVLLAGGIAAAAVIVLVLLSRWVRRGAMLSAVAAGLCTAMSAVFTKLTTDDLATIGVAGTARDWPGYLLLVSTVAGFLTIQAGFASGPLTWAVAAGLITDPVTSYLVGVLAFDVSLPTHPGSIAAIVASLLLLAGGIAALAHVPTVAGQFYPAFSHGRRATRT